MDTEVLKNFLNQLLENDKALKNELQERKKEQAEIIRKLDLLLQKISEEKQPTTMFSQENFKSLLNQETEKVIRLLQSFLSSQNKRKGWSLFAADFKAENFRVVFESVCKWFGILLGGFYVLHAVITHWK